MVQRMKNGKPRYHLLGFKATCVLMGRSHDDYDHHDLSEVKLWAILGNSIELATNKFVSGPWIDAYQAKVERENAKL